MELRFTAIKLHNLNIFCIDTSCGRVEVLVVIGVQKTAFGANKGAQLSMGVMKSLNYIVQLP